MTRLLFLAPALLSPVILAGAQTSAPSAAQFRQPSSSIAACPLDFSVARSSATEFIQTGRSPADPGSQQIDLRFQPAPEQKPLHADVVVHLLAPGPSLLPVRDGATAPPAVHDRSFHLDLGKDSDLRRRLDLGRTGGVLSVDLVALEFANGETWRTAADQRCRAVPSPFLPVSSR